MLNPNYEISTVVHFVTALLHRAAQGFEAPTWSRGPEAKVLQSGQDT